MKASQWVFSNKLKSYPAMNEYSPSYNDVKIGVFTYIFVWLCVLAILLKVLKQKLRKIPIIVGFITGVILIYLEYIIKYTKYSYMILPDKKMYSTMSSENPDYKVIIGKEPYGDLDIRSHGYIVTEESYNKYKKEKPNNFVDLTDYLITLSNPISGKKLRENEIPEIVDGYNIEMKGLSMTAYYISIVIITWIGYIYLEGTIDKETNIFSLLAILAAVISTIPVLAATSVVTMTKHIFLRQTIVHLATAFAIAALTERLIQ